MCYTQTIKYRCGCTSYSQLHPCELFPKMGGDPRDCSQFGTNCQEIGLTYCCPNDCCESTERLQRERRKREKDRAERDNTGRKRVMRRASFERAERLWALEQKRREGEVGEEWEKYKEVREMEIEDAQEFEADEQDRYEGDEEYFEEMEDKWARKWGVIPEPNNKMECVESSEDSMGEDPMSEDER